MYLLICLIAMPRSISDVTGKNYLQDEKLNVNKNALPDFNIAEEKRS